MNKSLITTLLITLCFIVQVRAQIAYYDALTLGRHMSEGQLERSSDTVFMILDKYIQPGVNNTKQQIIDSVNETSVKDFNPFIEISGGTEGNINALIKGGISKGLSSLGGLDVTSIANGVATFMIERSKEELTVAFFNHFKKFVEKNQEFKVLFPKTTGNLENLVAYKYPEMLPALRTSFYEDLQNITYHLDDVLELPRYQALLKNFPEIRVTIRSIRLVHEIESGASHPADVLTKFSNFTEWSDPLANSDFQNFGNTIKFSAMFSNSVRDSTSLSKSSNGKRGTAKAWVSFNELQSLIQDANAFNLYLGLIYQQSKTQKIHWFHDGKVYTFTSIMEKQKENIFLFENKLTEFIELADEVDNTLDTLLQKKKNKIPITNDDYYNYINTSLNVIEYGFSIADLFIDNNKFVVSDYAKIARMSNDLYRHVYREEYTQAITNATDILKSIKAMLSNDKQVLIAEVKRNNVSLGTDSFDELTSKDTTIITVKLKDNPSLVNKIKALYNSREALENYSGFLAGATKYGLFMANLVKANSEEEVQAVLESSALPVGSSSIKKNSKWNIAFQSYLGAYWSSTDANSFQSEKAWSNKFGVIAPIGFSFSYGLEKCGSLSLFASLIDLGAIVDYKLKYDTVQTNSTTTVKVSKDYKIELGQIFSPGAYLVYGLPWNLPLSVGLGGQYGPGLSSINSTGNTVIDNPYWRWSAFLAVDIPLFNIYNKERKR
jgi:hypothetical protein